MKTYYKENLPQSIGQAIYFYGNNADFDVLYYCEGDAEHGVILTSSALYYSLTQKGQLLLKDLTEIQVKKERGHEKELILVTPDTRALFYEHECDLEGLIEELVDATELAITYPMDVFNRIYYLSDLILNDVKDDVYEDVTLTPLQEEQLTSYLDTVQKAEELDDNNFRIEMEILVDHVTSLVHELELDSEDIDALEEAQKEMSQQEDQMFNQFQDLYANNKDTIKNMTGIDMDDIQNKSPEELNDMLDDLCTRFNISKDQLTKLAARFQNKHQN
jgi:hypothetical protein